MEMEELPLSKLPSVKSQKTLDLGGLPISRMGVNTTCSPVVPFLWSHVSNQSAFSYLTFQISPLVAIVPSGSIDLLNGEV